ncbi:MAG: ATPase, T2SS/T4P/T4SS family [Patescibacteria group bacterium]|jgi:type IV pilus assembly protein PilB|nr:ATPase, T2SS/T4P/T4SS family [Patescibacteria group bacterium]
MNVDPKQLKEFLTDAGLVEEDVIEASIKEAKKQGKKLGDLLIEKKEISEEELRKMYAYILGIPFVNLEKEEVPKEILQFIPEPIARKNNIIAFKKDNNSLRVAMLNPDDIQTLDFIKKKTGLKISPCFTNEESIKKVLQQYNKSLQAEFGDIINKNSEDVSGEEDLEKIAQDLPIIRIVNTLLHHAVLQSASDIHIEPDEKEVRVRYRIDGVLHEAMTLPKQVAPGIVARIKVLTSLKLDEHRVPQDGRFKLESDGMEDRKISFRVSVLPVFGGEKIVMRLLDESSKGLTLEKMGLWGESLEKVHQAIKKPNGMILVTGPTGSGKTTTLYTAVDILNTPEVNISTIEDPIEYRMQKINQTQVKSKIGMTFAAGLRALLRQDPDIIMVGEIRDSETMQIALNAAMTGHLVLSTLHTNSAAAAIPRMIDMKAEAFLVASTVNVMIAQRLVRRICPDCKEEYKLSKKQLEEIEHIADFKKIEKVIKTSESVELKSIKNIKSFADATFYKGKGCKKCNNEGYKSRIGIYEVLEVSEKIQKAISRNATAQEIENEAKDEGMFVMLIDGLIKSLQGITTIEEVLRVTKE